MKKNNRFKYSGIVSFEDFQYEKEKLIFEKRLIETRLNFRFSLIKDAFSASRFFPSMAKDILWPKLISFIGDIVNKKEHEENRL